MRAPPPTRLLLAALVALGGAGCERTGQPAPAARVGVADGAPAPRSTGPPAHAGPSLRAVGDPLPDSVFARLVLELSEPGGYFDTDNLISNEASYLHALDRLADLRVGGGGYVGVGPDQNFSYIAAVRPELAFIIDIRRDNLLQHLWFRGLFEGAATRLDYLCAMVVRRCGGDSRDLTVDALVARVDAAPPLPAADTLLDRVARSAARPGLDLDADDRATLRSIHRRFAADGLDLRFSSHGREPRPEYPTLRRLLLERDRAGRQRNYLASEADYAFVRDLERANRVVPVVGDLAGPHALRAIGQEVRRRGHRVSALYVSNVEFYLFGGGGFDRFMASMESLPVGDDAVLIRSYFNRWRPHPASRPGYASAQLVQEVGALLAAWQQGGIRSYRELVGAP